MNTKDAINARRAIKHYDADHRISEDHVISFMIAVGKGTTEA